MAVRHKFAFLLIGLIPISAAHAISDVVQTAQSLMIASQDSISPLSELKTKFQNAKNPSDKTGYALGILQNALRRKDKTTVAAALKTVESTGPAQAPYREVHAIIVSQARELLGQYELAAFALAPFSNRQGNSFAKFSTTAYLRNLIKAGHIQIATQYFVDNEGNFDRFSDPRELREIKLSLATALERNGETEFAARIAKDIAVDYPVGAESQSALTLYEKLQCENDLYQGLYRDLEQRMSQARLALYKLGPLPDVREFAFALAGINEKKILSLKIEDAVKAPLADTVRNNLLLRQLEFLVANREKELAEKLARYLRAMVEHGAIGLELDKVYFLYARAMNGVHKPVEAAKAYQTVYTKYPKARLAAQARSRYAASLHFAEDFKKAAAAYRALPKASSKKVIALWNAFWADYLSKDNTAAMRSLNQLLATRFLDADLKLALRYWQGRVFARLGDKINATRVLNDLQKNANNSFYGLMARWRLSVEEDAKAKSEKKPIKPKVNALRTWKYEDKSTEVPTARFQFARTLLEFGLVEFASVEVDTQSPVIRDEKEAMELAKIAFKAQNFKVTSLVPRRTVWALKSIPTQDDLIVKEFTQNAELWRLSFPLAYGPIVEEMARKYKVDPFLIFSVMRAESNYDFEAESPVGALGVLQIMPQTGTKIAAALGISHFDSRNLSKPEVGVAFAAWYLSRLVAHYKGNLFLAVAAYNAGPEAVDRWMEQSKDFELDEFIENIPFKETKTYVGRVILNLDMYQRIYSAEKSAFLFAAEPKLSKPLVENDLF